MAASQRNRSTIPSQEVRGLAISESSPVCARFDRFEINFLSGDLRTSEGSSTRIQPLPLQVLRLLLEAEGGVVSREQVRTTLWSEETFVDFEHGVNTAVKKLRQALGDSTANPKFIQTLPKVGYRFLVPVQWVAEMEEKRNPKTASREEASGADSKLAKRSLFAKTSVAVAVAIFVAGAYLLYHSLPHRTKKPEPSISLAVTSVGEKYSPSLSPDGKQLAYAWNGGSGPYFSIYVKFIGTEEPLRLTKQDSIDFNPVWSPDGRYIAFCRIRKGDTGIYIIPNLGGAERKLRDTHWEERDFDQYFWYFGRLSWSPDGKLLAFSDRASSNEPTSIYFLPLDSLPFVSSRHGDYRATTTLRSRQMVKPSHLTAVRKVSRPSTRCRLEAARSDASFRAPNMDGAWHGLPIAVTLSSVGQVGWQNRAGFGRYLLVEASRNGCNLVRREPSPPFAATGLCTRAKSRT